MKVSEKIALLRKNKGMTQTELADILNYTRQAIQKWESGLSNPDIYTLPKLANIFNVSVDSMVDIEISEEALLKEALGFVESTKPLTSVQFSKTRSFLNIFLMPIVSIIIIFLGLGYFFLTILGFAFLASPVIDVAVFILSIVEMISRPSLEIGYIILSIGRLIFTLGLLYPTLCLANLVIKSWNTIMIYFNNRLRYAIKKTAGKIK